jgi:hypothetical protein
MGRTMHKVFRYTIIKQDNPVQRSTRLTVNINLDNINAVYGDLAQEFVIFL